MNDTNKFLQQHRSIRVFNNEEITKEEINTIIESGMRGATAGNMMLYSLIKVENVDNLKFLSEKCDNQKFIANAKFALIFVADSHKYYKYFKNRNVNNYQEPSIADFMLGIQDGMICAQNCVISAESMGIGTCYIGDILENYEDIKEKFNLPKNVMPFTMVVFGRYDKTPPLRERFDKEFVVFDEKYADVDDEFIDKMFRKEEEKSPDFAERFYNRKINSEFFKEMNRSIKLYVDEWE